MGLGKMFTDLLDEHAPVKKKVIKREHVPFMTTDLLDAIRCRRKLKQTYYATKHPVDWQKVQTTTKQDLFVEKEIDLERYKK